MKNRERQTFTCECGFSWLEGLSGSHSCTSGYQKQIKELKGQLALYESSENHVKVSAEELNKIEDAARNATPGPWDYNGNCKYGVWSKPENCYVFMTGSHVDAVFSAVANPTTILKMAAYIKRLENICRLHNEN